MIDTAGTPLRDGRPARSWTPPLVAASWLLFVLPLVGCAAAPDPEPTAAFAESNTVRYTVRPGRQESLVVLRVAVAFRGTRTGETRFALPRDRFGVPAMHRWIRAVEPDPGVRLEETEPGVYTARHTPGAEVGVSYTVAYDPDEVGFVAFGPDVGPDHFHFFGSQWMARVGPAGGTRRVEIAFDVDEWPFAIGSSYGLGSGPHPIRATDRDLDYSVIAGGSYRTARSECRGRPVLAMVHGSFELTDERIFSLVERVVCGQREAFGDFDRPFFTVFVTERERIEAGAPLLHGFTAFLEPRTSLPELRLLLAHEMIHTWIPRTARLVDPARPDAPEARTRWFHEGFTEYLARLILVRQELAPLSWMVERTNEDLVRLAHHPYRTLTLDEVVIAADQNRYNNHHHRLHYLRGALLALNWDTRIGRASGDERSLLDAMRRVVRSARDAGGEIGLPRLDGILRSLGVDATADIRRHLERGESIAPLQGAFGPAYELAVCRVPGFDPGYSVVGLIENGRLSGVAPDGPAYRAGLRDDMEVTGTENASPWTGRWEPGRPTTVVVRDGDEELAVEFHAVGEEIEVPYLAPGPDDLSPDVRRVEVGTATACDPIRG